MGVVKKCISIPESVFLKAEKAAGRQGVSRSELYSMALESYLRKERENEVTEDINSVCEQVDTSLDPGLAAMQEAAWPGEDWGRFGDDGADD
jgi:metal-responsive CopG/Arc/MetJ family transcriptional regulator